MKRVLITGVTGFVGSHMTDYIIENTDDKILAKINEKLKLASMGHFGVKHYIKYVNSYIVELNNGWVVEMELGGRVLHIYEDKTK